MLPAIVLWVVLAVAIILLAFNIMRMDAHIKSTTDHGKDKSYFAFPSA